MYGADDEEEIPGHFEEYPRISICMIIERLEMLRFLFCGFLLNSDMANYLILYTILCTIDSESNDGSITNYQRPTRFPKRILTKCLMSIINDNLRGLYLCHI